MLFMKESHHNNSIKLIFDAPFLAMIISVTGIALLAYMDGVKAPILGSVMVTTGSAIGIAIYKVLNIIIKTYLLME